MKTPGKPGVFVVDIADIIGSHVKLALKVLTKIGICDTIRR